VNYVAEEGVWTQNIMVIKLGRVRWVGRFRGGVRGEKRKLYWGLVVKPGGIRKTCTFWVVYGR